MKTITANVKISPFLKFSSMTHGVHNLVKYMEWLRKLAKLERQSLGTIYKPIWMDSEILISRWLIENEKVEWWQFIFCYLVLKCLELYILLINWPLYHYEVIFFILSDSPCSEAFCDINIVILAFFWLMLN